MLKLQDVFEVVSRPSGKNMVGLKWIFTVKWNKKGKIEKRKARTVAKGYTQMIKEDYNETYASVARLEFVCLICTIVVSRWLQL